MSMSVDERSDGTRYNWTGLGSKYANCELIIYLKHSCGSINDEVSGKMGGGRHSDGSSPKCYDLGCDTENAACRIRYEDKHPEYDDGPTGKGSGVGGGVGLHGSWVGYRFIKRNNANKSITCEIWQDAGNNEGNTPANAWRNLAGYTITSPYWPNPPSDHAETVRVDEVSCLQYKWQSIREIQPGDSTTPGTGGTGGTGGIGGSSGGGTGGTGTGGGTTPGSGPVIPGGIGGSYGGGGSSGDGTGGTGTGIDTPAPQETSVLYERKEFWIRYNIKFISGDACGLGKNPETLPLQNIYSVNGDVYVEGKLYRKCGLHVATYDKTNPANTSMFIGKPPIRYMQLTMRKAGINPLAGDITVCIRDKFFNLVTTLALIPVTTLTANDQNFPLSFPNNIRDLQVGDHLSVEYDGNTTDDYIRIKVSQKDVIDGLNTRLFVFDGATWIYDEFADFGADISV